MSRKTIDQHVPLPVAMSNAAFAEYLRFFGRRMDAIAEFARKTADCRNISELTEAASVYWQAGIHDYHLYLAETYSRIGSLAIDTAEVIDHATTQKTPRRHSTTGKRRPVGISRVGASSKLTKANG